MKLNSICLRDSQEMLTKCNTVFLAGKKILKHKREKNTKYGLFELFNIRREQIHSLLSTRG